MPPLAGIFGVSRLRFAVYEVAGVCLWASLWAGLGYVFKDAIEHVALRLSELAHVPRIQAVSDPFSARARAVPERPKSSNAHRE